VEEEEDGVTTVDDVDLDDEVTMLPIRLGLLKHSSRANRGRGSDIGLSVNRLGRSLLRGSVGISSAEVLPLSSQRGVPGRLPLPPSAALFFRTCGISTSQGMIRGNECLLLEAPSPELSVDSRETLRLGLPRVDADAPPLVLFLPASRVGVEEGVVPLWEDEVSWAEEADIDWSG